MKMRLKELTEFASRWGYVVEKRGRVYQWWDNRDHSIIGECKTIRECYNDISNDILFQNIVRPKV